METIVGKSNFVVLTTQRTGSSMFMDVLNGYPDIEGHMELFLDQKRTSPGIAGANDLIRYFEWKDLNFSFRPFSVWKYLSKLYAKTPTVGFKLMYSHLRNYPDILPYLIFKKIKIIHLVRRNYLDIIISEKIAELTGKSHTIDKAEVNSEKLFLDPVSTLNKVLKLDSNTQKIRRLISKLVMCNRLEVYYEDVVNDPVTTLRKVKQFLDIDISADQIQSNLKKRQTKKKSEIISNYDEIYSTLINAGFGRLLND